MSKEEDKAPHSLFCPEVARQALELAITAAANQYMHTNCLLKDAKAIYDFMLGRSEHFEKQPNVDLN